MRLVLATAALLLALAPAADAARATKPKPRPDLVVTLAGGMVRDGTLYVSARVMNRGRRTARRSNLEFKIGVLSFRPMGSVRRLKHRREVVVWNEFPVSLAPGTTFRVSACADPEGRVRELREDNNCRTSPLITVPVPEPVPTPAPGLPELPQLP
jgi:hypothetical protein